MPYCGAACQAQHWAACHKDQCKMVTKGGGAERYYADQNYKAAVAVAVKKCAEDTKGQTCYICTEIIEPRTKEGLVRMCSCGDRDGVASGTAGIVHVSCLVRQAQIVCDDEMSNEDRGTKWSRWDACQVCGQRFNGTVACALGWACWRTYLSRPLTDELRRVALCALGVGLQKTHQYESAVAVYQLSLAEHRRSCGQRRMSRNEREGQFGMQNNIAILYGFTGRQEEALKLHIAVLEGRKTLFGPEDKNTIHCALNVANCLLNLGAKGDIGANGDRPRITQAREMLRTLLPLAKRNLDPSDECFHTAEPMYAQSILYDPSVSRKDKLEAKVRLGKCLETLRRVLGSSHTSTREMELCLRTADGHIPPH